MINILDEIKFIQQVYFEYTEARMQQNKADKFVELDIGSETSSIHHESSKQKQKRQKQNEKKQQEAKKQMRNVKFYKNQLKSNPDGDFIDVIHKKWWGNYELLQSHHGFIQWLFPNSFQSRFNRLAMPLSEEQAKQFIRNKEIAQKYVKSYMMMLQFYGMKLKCKQSGQLTRSRNPKFQGRYHKTLLTSFHNHMRITRMLSSLVMCGFGRYARQFSLFLGEQINKPYGYLKGLKKYGIYEKQWKQYSEYIQKQQTNSIYFKSMKKREKNEKHENISKL